MTDTPQTIVIEKKSTPLLPWAIIAAMGILILWMVTCNPGKAIPNTAIADSLSRELNTIQVQYKADTQLLKVALNNQVNETKRAQQGQDSVGGLLAGTKAQLSRMRKEYMYLREGLPDTGMVTVSQKYIGKCDSCWDLAEQQSRDIDRYKEYAEATELSLSKQLSLKDTAIKLAQWEAEGYLKVANQFKAEYYRAEGARLQALNAIQFYPLATAWWNPINQLNVGVGGALKLRNSSIIGGLVLTGKDGLSFQLIMGKKLSFRKR